MIQQKILPIVCVVAIAAQILIVKAHSSLAKITNLNSTLAQLNTSGDVQEEGSTGSANPKNIRFSRRYAYKYKFECTPDNQTELAIYQARRNRQGEIVGSWKKAANRPLIQWTQTGSLEFGDKYSPEVRCQAVTDRFNQHFMRGGKPKMPPLSEGILNGVAVVCAAKAGGCNSSNLLWTLSSKNRGTNGTIIVHIVSSLKGDASDRPITETPDYENLENQGPTLNDQEIMLEVDMEKLIEEAITEEQKKLENEE